VAKSTATRKSKLAAIASPRPRNPYAAAARQRVAGPHGPSRKSERAAAKVRLKKGIGES
jgi:hypothetical protein